MSIRYVSKPLKRAACPRRGFGGGGGGGARGDEAVDDPEDMDFYEWIWKRKFQFTTVRDGPFYAEDGITPTPSHNDLFGGMLKIPDEVTETRIEFQAALVRALCRGDELIGLAENRTKFSAFYLDLDFVGPTEVRLEDIQAILVVGNRLLRNKAFPQIAAGHEDLIQTVVCMSPPKDLGDGRMKTGVHVIYPNLVLQYESMVRINIAMREEVASAMGAREDPCNAWEDVFDIGMYRTGLRMLYVDKPVPCDVCHPDLPREIVSDTTQRMTRTFLSEIEAGTDVDAAKKRAQAEARVEVGKPTSVILASHPQKRRRKEVAEDTRRCRRGCKNGKIGAKRPYRPVAMLDAWGSILYAYVPGEISRQALKQVSIRRPTAFRENPPFVPWDGCPEMPTRMHHAGCELVTSTNGVGIAQALAGRNPVLSKSLIGSRRKIFVRREDPRMAILQRLVRTYAPERFRELCVTNASTNADVTEYTVNVRGPGSRLCMNRRGGPHRRAIVFFSVTRSGIVQRCPNRNDVDIKTRRVSCVACHRFRGPLVRLAEDDAKVLFDGHEVEKVHALLISDQGEVRSIVAEAEAAPQIPTLKPVPQEEGPEDDEGGAAESGGTRVSHESVCSTRSLGSGTKSKSVLRLIPLEHAVGASESYREPERAGAAGARIGTRSLSQRPIRLKYIR